jgi:VWFA-related protein
MFRKPGIVLLLNFSLLISTWAQTQTSPVRPPQEKTDEDDVVRITTNLVQVDVTVTDKDGRQVTDLTSEDFEIREEGQPQQITNLSYIGISPGTSSAETIQPSNKRDSGAPAPPPIRLRAAQVARTLAVLVDDEYMSFGSVGATSDALKKFIAERIEPNDLVGIFRTARSNTLLQQFTVDRKQLALAVRRLTWLPGAHNSVDVFKQVRSDVDNPEERENEGVVPGLSSEDMKGLGRDRAEYFGGNFRVPRIISAFRFLINDMRKLPGRKAIVLFADGVRFDAIVQRPMRLLVDYANRSGIVIHTIDARGLVNTDFIGADENPLSDQRSLTREQRARALFTSHDGMVYLAEETGGIFTRNTNDIGRGLRRALEEQRGYYLIGYRPSEDSFKGGVGGFRKLDVRVKREGLRVRTRKGFVGVTDEVLNVPERPRTGDSQLYVALVSPIPATDVPLRLTPIVGQDAKGNSFLRALVHIDAQTINFAEEANGWKRMILDVAAVTLGQNGRVVNEFTRTHTVRIGPDTLAPVRQNGVIYSADIPVKSAGAYQFRIVVRDANSKKFGTASQFIEIPDLKKDALALSGIVLTEATSDGKPGLPPAVPVEAALSPVQFFSNPAVRRFRPGAELSYAHLIYNARAVASTRKPQLTTQVRLFHEGKEVFTGPDAVFDPGQQKDTARLSNDGVVHLSPTAASGDYSLQIIVKDHAVGKNPRVATQWIDFEVVE